MTWTRLSDGFADSPAVLALSDAAFRSHVTALIWSNRHLTDGVIPSSATRMLGAERAIVAELIAAGLWTDAGTDYRLDWSDQEPAQTVKERRDANAKKNREFRERGRRHATGDHSMCRFCDAVRDQSRAPSRDESVTPHDRPTRPDPTRPDPTHREGGEEEERDATPADADETSASASVTPASPSVEWTERMRKRKVAAR